MSCSSSATVWWLTACPWRCPSAASLRTLFVVQRRGDSGSPRLVGSISASRSARNVRARSTARGRPPPSPPPTRRHSAAPDRQRLGPGKQPAGAFVDEGRNRCIASADGPFIDHLTILLPRYFIDNTLVGGRGLPPR